MIFIFKTQLNFFAFFRFKLKMCSKSDRVVTFNVGGSIFSINYSSLISKNEENQNNVLAIEAKNKDDVFINRDPTYFNFILNYFRYHLFEFKLPKSKELKYLLVEAEFYKIDGLVDEIKYNDYSLSKILSDGEIKRILKCVKSKFTQIKSIYRATRNGFSSLDFHSNCDGVSNTLTIIKTNNGKRFGGYTEAKWSSDIDGTLHGYQKDKNAFIFRIGNSSVNFSYEILECLPNKPAIYNHIEYGPCFGEGHEICISSNCDNNYKSYSHLGLSYIHKDFRYKSKISSSYLAGEGQFKVKEIEIFELL